MQRHQGILGIALAACLALAGASASADTWPSRPIRIIVPTPAGGAGDLVPRVIAERLSKRLGQAVIIENKGGANGLIGTQAIAKAPPDGYTIGASFPGPVVIGKRLFPSIGYEPSTDLVPIALTYETPFVLITAGSDATPSVAKLLERAKHEPNILTASIPANGSLQHLLTEMMKIEAGVQVNVIPYSGGPQAATAVVGGQVTMSWGALPNVTSLIAAGRVRALAVSSEKRSPLLKDVPTLIEQGLPTLVATNWNGLIAPAGTPKDIVYRLNREVNEILKQPDVIKQFEKMGVTPLAGTVEQVAAFHEREEAKWARLIRQANLKFE